METRWSECMTTYDPGFWAEQGQKLLSYYFQHFIKFAWAKLFNWNCLANNNSDWEVLWTATSGWPCHLQFSCKSYFVMTSLFFSTELVIPCFYIQIFLIVVNLLVDWELFRWINSYCFVALICCGLKFFQPVWFLISFVSKYAKEYKGKLKPNWFKHFAPKII